MRDDLAVTMVRRASSAVLAVAHGAISTIAASASATPARTRDIGRCFSHPASEIGAYTTGAKPPDRVVSVACSRTPNAGSRRGATGAVRAPVGIIAVSPTPSTAAAPVARSVALLPALAFNLRGRSG